MQVILLMWFGAFSYTKATRALGGVNDHDHNDVAHFVRVFSIATE
jgi:hypothetical protein